MKDEYVAADFNKSIKNPYFDKLNKKTEIAVRHDIYQIFCEIGKKNNVEPEVIMNRCLTDYAIRLRDDN